MQRFLLVFLAVIGLLSILVFFGGLLLLGIGFIAWSGEQHGVPERTVLELHFERPVVESIPNDPFARLFLDRALVLRDLVDAIDRAREDERVVGLIAHASGVGMGLAQMQEVRDALERFRESGKPTLAFAETFGELSPGNASYYLASACETVYLQPSGDLNLTGLYLEQPFAHGALEKLGVEAQMGKRWEYKNAADLYLESGFTEAHREASQHIVDGLFSQMVAEIATSRGLAEDAVRDWVDRSPMSAKEAVDAGLVDELRYYDEVEAEFSSEGAIHLLAPGEYVKRAGRPHAGSPTLALVHGYGTIRRGESSLDGLGGNPTMGSDTVAEALREASENERVAAIVFRVSSPGGSYVASDAVRREVLRARERGKPVVVSMGDYAASGGYFVSMGADEIVAQPATLTGSIGVYGGKLVLTGLMNKLGVTFDGVSTAENASIFSVNRTYSDSEWAEISASLDRIYADFTEKAAADREIPLNRLQEIARGRVWTGEDAVDLGLVDRLGGLDVAARAGLERAGLDPDGGYRFRPFPGPKSTWELLAERLEEESGGTRTGAQLARAIQPLGALARQLGWLQEPEVLEAPVPTIGGLD